jgi:hypothetical protein
MQRRQRHNVLFRVACDGLKLLAILLAGFISACLFLAPFGATGQVTELMKVALPFFFRLAVCLLSLIAIAGLFESLE